MPIIVQLPNMRDDPAGYKGLLQDQCKGRRDLRLVANENIDYEELEDVFSAIPKHITSLGYSSNGDQPGLVPLLKKIQGKGLTQLFLDVPADLKNLKIYLDEISDIFPHLRTLRLNLQKIHLYTSQDQASALKDLIAVFATVFVRGNVVFEWRVVGQEMNRLLDLSDNNLGQVPCIEEALKEISPRVTRLDLRNNFKGKSRSELYSLMMATPVTVKEIAYDSRGFIKREELLKELYFDYSFQFNCLAGLAMAGGSGLLIAGILLSHSLLAGVGGGLILGGALIGTLSTFGFFTAGDPPPPPPALLEAAEAAGAWDGECNGALH